VLAVKVCGIKDFEDAVDIASLGVWALGFILVPQSPRFIEPREAKAVIHAVRKRVLTVGVFQDSSLQEIRDLRAFCGFDLVQLHGHESPSFCRRLQKGVIKAFGVDESFEAAMVQEYEGVVDYFLFDTKKGSRSGGTGVSFPWEKIQGVTQKETPVIVAGGLNEKNLHTLLQAVIPFGVDFNSGVEKSPGKKDVRKIRKIMTAMKEMSI